jgi:NDP-sugar pyrophosphorylase family protein
LLHWLRLSGFSKVVLCVGYKRLKIKQRYRNGERWGLQIVYSVEHKALGTAGAIKNAHKHINGKTFLVLNGDSFVDLDLRALLQFHRRSRSLATLALARVRAGSRYGQVQLDAGGRITRFIEKEPGGFDGIGPGWINTGVYVFDRRTLRFIPSIPPVSLETEVLPHLVGQRFFGFPVTGYFIDIGIPEDYRRAQQEFPERFPL